MPIVVNRPKTTIHLDSVGEVSLRSVTLGATERFFEIAAKSSSNDKEFVQDILFCLLLAPRITKEEFDQIPDDDLKKLAQAFIASETYTLRDYTNTGDIFADLRKAVTKSIEEEVRRIQESFRAFNKRMEEYSKNVFNSIGRNAFKALIPNNISEMNRVLSSALDSVAKVNFQPVQALLAENKQALEAFSQYWQNYFILNEKITTNMFAALAPQNFLPQKDLTKEIREAMQVSVKNQIIFTEHMREINSYPEEQKVVLYKKAEIRSFSIGELEAILQKIKKSVEIHSQLMFWEARKERRLAKNLERIAQGHIMGLLYMGLPNKLVFSCQQPNSGSGIIDILITFCNELGEVQKVILELKVFGKGHLLQDGIEQTAQYMENEDTEHSYRIIFNATDGELGTQSRLASNGKTVKDIVININLPNPSVLDKKKYIQ